MTKGSQMGHTKKSTLKKIIINNNISDQCEIDGELEYEFPCYNRENFEGMWWNANDSRYSIGQPNL